MNWGYGRGPRVRPVAVMVVGLFGLVSLGGGASETGGADDAASQAMIEDAWTALLDQTVPLRPDAGLDAEPDEALEGSGSETQLTGALAHSLTITPDQAADMLPSLTIADPHRDGYDRDAFPHWERAMDIGWAEIAELAPTCRVRAATLIRDGRDVIVGEKCKVT
ncbi:MAG: hypothetical protein LBK72_10965, partial [Bifidobacteriaceae bacterium]|nr:hypothetical protein [Bifidobacteriaceae bacterium]